MLLTERLTVAFGGLRALDGVDLEVPAGHVTGLIGPNGAGKTTLFNVVTGLQRPNSGRVRLDGVDLTRLGPRRRANLGLARTFQRLEVFSSLTVRENVLVALEGHSWHGSRALRFRTADELLDRVGLQDLADSPAGTLPTGTARMLEIARALAIRPKVLLLDEVSSGLDADESRGLGALLCELAGDGAAVLLVEHDMDLVMRICDVLVVLNFGQVIARGTAAEVGRDPAVRASYLGGAATSMVDAPAKAAPA